MGKQELGEVEQGEVQGFATGNKQADAPLYAEGHSAREQLGKKDLRMLVDPKVNRSQQCVLAAKTADGGDGILRCIR